MLTNWFLSMKSGEQILDVLTTWGRSDLNVQPTYRIARRNEGIRGYLFRSWQTLDCCPCTRTAPPDALRHLWDNYKESHG